LNHDPPDVCLTSSWDYRCEPWAPGPKHGFWKMRLKRHFKDWCVCGNDLGYNCPKTILKGCPKYQCYIVCSFSVISLFLWLSYLRMLHWTQSL
jgi:hypothetical protein